MPALRLRRLYTGRTRKLGMVGQGHGNKGARLLYCGALRVLPQRNRSRQRYVKTRKGRVMDKCLEENSTGTVETRSDKGKVRYKKCPDCCGQMKVVPNKLFCNSCFKRRYGCKPNTVNPKTLTRRRVERGSSGTVDTRSEHSERPIWVHRPGSNQIGNGSSGAGDQLQQHISPSKENRKRRIVVGDQEMLLAYMGYRLAQTK